VGREKQCRRTSRTLLDAVRYLGRVGRKTATQPSDSSQTYLITDVPPPSPKGSCHRISLKVEHKNATTLAPEQYCNTKDPLSDPLNGTAVGSKLLDYANSPQLSTLPLSLQVTPLSAASGASRINVAVAMPSNILYRRWKSNQLILSVALVGLVYDKNHALIARFSDTVCPPPECGLWYEGAVPPGNVSIPPLTDSLKRIEELVVPSSYQTQLELEPGDYQVELEITDGQKFGRAQASVSAGDFPKGNLGMSGVALCKTYHTPPLEERGPTRAPQYVPLMVNGIEFTPAGNTQFKKGDQFMAYVEIYNSQVEAGATKLYLEMKVIDTRTGELKTATGLRPVESAMASDKSAVPVVWSLAIDKFPTGTYSLEAQASDSAGHTTDWRCASFTVE